MSWDLYDQCMEEYNRQQRDRWRHDEEGTIEVMGKLRVRCVDDQSEPGSWARELSRKAGHKR